MVFGPARSRPSCAVSLSGRLLEVVPISPLPWCCAHTVPAMGRPYRPRSRPWPSAFSTKYLVGPLRRPTSHFLLSTYVLPSATFGTKFVGDCTRSLAQLDLAQRRWGRHLLGWASFTPCASVLYELALPDSLRLSTGRALALFGRLHSLSLQARAFLLPRQYLLSCRTSQVPGPTGVSLVSNTTLQGTKQILVSGHAAPQRSPAGGSITLSIPSWIEHGFIVSVAASPSSLVFASTLKLSVPTCWITWSTIPLYILVWPGGGGWR